MDPYANYLTIAPPLAEATPPSFETCYFRTTCRLCHNTELTHVLSFPPTPPANAFVPQHRLSETEETFPLDVYFCHQCTHLQLLNIVRPEVLYRNYVYVSGTSPLMVKHLEEYATESVQLCSVQPDDLVVEFGSNDGTLLHIYKQLGMRIIGVDPAVNLAKQATAKGVPTLAEFFNGPTARQMKTDGYLDAKLVCANHCCAHIDDLHSVVDGVLELLAPDGVWIMEVGYLLDVYQKNLFDTVYHEHCDYHTLRPLITFFRSRGLKVLRATRSTIQGGSLRVFIGRDGTAPTLEDGPSSIALRLREESEANLHNPSTFSTWDSAITRTGIEIISMIRGLKQSGHTIAGYGAPAKATTLMYRFDIDSSVIDFIVDDNPLKQGLYTPGRHIPVVSSSFLYDNKPDYILVLAWNFAEPIIAKHQWFLKANGRFIVPLPNVRIIS